MSYWWVNQRQTWRDEVDGGYLWSPQRNANGSTSRFYDFMTDVRTGDVVFSHFNRAIRFVGVVTQDAVAQRKPDFGFRGANWSDDGWAVMVHYEAARVPVSPQSHIDLYNQVADDRYRAMNRHGRVNQFYLFALPDVFGDAILAASQVSLARLRQDANDELEDLFLLEEASAVLCDVGLVETERRVLALSRVGQGKFKSNVARIEKCCRLTGLSEPGHLRASHIKPWRESTNVERVDGANGLLLSPHVDHLFDRGYLSFTNSGRVLVSPALGPAVPDAWRLDLKRRGPTFSRDQANYLEYHRDELFLSAGVSSQN